jgi:hypothetical protein
MDLTQCHLMRTNLENLLTYLMEQVGPGGPEVGSKCTLTLDQFGQIVEAYRQLHDYVRSYATVVLPPNRPVAVPLEIEPGALIDVEYGKPYIVVFRAPPESLLDEPAHDLEYPPIPLAVEIPGSVEDEEEASHLRFMKQGHVSSESQPE